jgi:hypothetical protein
VCALRDGTLTSRPNIIFGLGSSSLSPAQCTLASGSRSASNLTRPIGCNLAPKQIIREMIRLPRCST